MRSPALAIGWEFRRRHRWGLLALAGYLIALATIKLVMVGPGHRVNVDDPEKFAALIVVPLSTTITYFLAVFTFGLDGDLAARQSMYPPRKFTLPISTAALAGWPMLYGSAAMALLWVATRLFAVWPSDFDIPVIWPAVLAASLLAWTQALTWMPYALPGLRVIVTVLWLASIDAIVLLALHYHAHEPAMVAFLAPQLPLAYLVARFAVARARRGDVPDWSGAFARLGQIANVRPNQRAHFPSPARAQAWLEWRQQGRSLPALVGILLPFELALLFVAGKVPSIIFAILLAVMFTPPFMAAFTAATVHRSNPAMGDSYGVMPFIAKRPLTSAALIAAKLKMTIWSTLASWLLVIVAIPVALSLSNSWPVVIEQSRHVQDDIGTTRAVVFVLLLLSGCILLTWKQLVQSLYIGLTGRAWLIKGSVFLALALLSLIGPILHWISNDRAVKAALWNGLPWILWFLVCVKMPIAGWVAVRLRDNRLLSDRTLVIGAAGWCVTVLALYGLLAWFFSTPFVPRSLLVLVAILTVPLARLSAAPLALARNRHR